MDELYKRKKIIEDNKIKVFLMILGRIHSKIKITSRLKCFDMFCFYIIPEFLVGVPRYDLAACTGFVIDKLTKNGFHIKYTYPNLLFISWKHYIPAYRRLEYKKRTGVSIDGLGNILPEKKEVKTVAPGKNLVLSKKNMNFKKINTYKPTGSLIYDANLLKKITDKIHK
tara:strand:+ start:134 stop:640 length:507 start_codon:yes stop_codon:yes gene_type:complete